MQQLLSTCLHLFFTNCLFSPNSFLRSLVPVCNYFKWHYLSSSRPFISSAHFPAPWSPLKQVMRSLWRLYSSFKHFPPSPHLQRAKYCGPSVPRSSQKSHSPPPFPCACLANSSIPDLTPFPVAAARFNCRGLIPSPFVSTIIHLTFHPRPITVAMYHSYKFKLIFPQ